jgi:hypothetical protein
MTQSHLGKGPCARGPRRGPRHPLATGWFRLLQDNPLAGLVDLDLLLVVDNVLLVVVALAVYVALRPVSPSVTTMATGLWLVAIAMFIASNHARGDALAERPVRRRDDGSPASGLPGRPIVRPQVATEGHRIMCACPNRSDDRGIASRSADPGFLPSKVVGRGLTLPVEELEPLLARHVRCLRCGRAGRVLWFELFLRSPRGENGCDRGAREAPHPLHPPGQASCSRPRLHERLARGWAALVVLLPSLAELW